MPPHCPVLYVPVLHVSDPHVSQVYPLVVSAHVPTRTWTPSWQLLLEHVSHCVSRSVVHLLVLYAPAGQTLHVLHTASVDEVHAAAVYSPSLHALHKLHL